METIYVLVICFLSLYLWKLLQRNPKLAHIPGPKGLPFLGTFLEKKDRLEFNCAKWVKEHGPVLKIPIINQELIVLNTYETIYEALIKRGSDFAGRPQKQNFRSKFLNDFKGLAFANPTPAWIRLRKISHAKMKQYDMGMARIESIQLRIIHRMVNLFRANKGKPFDPHLITYNMSLSTMTMLTCGRIFTMEQEEFKLFEKMVKAAAEISAPAVLLNLFPFIRFFGAKSFQNMVFFMNCRYNLYKSMRARVMADPDKEVMGGVLYALCQAWEEVQKMGIDPHLPPDQRDIDEKDVEIGFVGILVAGVATTSRFFYAYLNIIAQHPRIQKILQDEVDQVVGPSNVVTLKHKASMHYTVATMYELLRFCSVTPFNLPHCTLRDTHVGGHAIPKGTEVLINSWQLHHDDEFWDAPHEFIPERFLDEEGHVLDKSHPNRQHLMAFGAGTRVCLGEQMALSRLFLLLASTSQIFTMKVGPMRVSCDSRDFIGTGLLDPCPYEIIAEDRNGQLYMDSEDSLDDRNLVDAKRTSNQA